MQHRFLENSYQQNRLRRVCLLPTSHFHLCLCAYIQLVLVIFLFNLYHKRKSIAENQLYFRSKCGLFCWRKTIEQQSFFHSKFLFDTIFLSFEFILHVLFWIWDFPSLQHAYSNHLHQHKQLLFLIWVTRFCPLAQVSLKVLFRAYSICLHRLVSSFCRNLYWCNEFDSILARYL